MRDTFSVSQRQRVDSMVVVKVVEVMMDVWKEREHTWDVRLIYSQGEVLMAFFLCSWHFYDL